MMEPFTREEFEKDREAQREAQNSIEQGAAEKAIRVALVKVEQLTKNPEWDLFLQICQFKLDESKAELESIEESLTGYVTGDTMALVQLRHKYVSGCVDSIEVLMDLPRTIVEDPEKAKEDAGLQQEPAAS